LIKIPVDRIVKTINQRKARRVLIQAPEGVKIQLEKTLPEILEKTGIEIIIHGDSCFGACDLALHDLEKLSCDLLIHLAHTPLCEVSERTIFINVEDSVELSRELIVKAVNLFRGKKVGLIASAQYLELMRKVKKELQKNDVEVIVGRSPNPYLAEGQVIGCEISAASSIEKHVDSFLIVSSGYFHALGVALKVERKVFLLDPYREDLLDMDSIVRKKLAIIAEKIDRAKRARRFGVIIGLKGLQTKPDSAFNIVKRLKKLGKETFIIAISEITPEKLLYYPDIECFIQTICPRISIDDIESYKKPLLSYEQFEVMIGDKEFEDTYPSARRV